MSKKWDPDVLALKQACTALEQHSDFRTLMASLLFIWDRYIDHPPKNAWWAQRGINPLIDQRSVPLKK